MLYVNKDSMTCDFDGTVGTVVNECAVLLCQVYNKLIKECGKEFADETLVEIGRKAARTEEELLEEFKEMLADADGVLS